MRVAGIFLIGCGALFGQTQVFYSNPFYSISGPSTLSTVAGDQCVVVPFVLKTSGGGGPFNITFNISGQDASSDKFPAMIDDTPRTYPAPTSWCPKAPNTGSANFLVTDATATNTSNHPFVAPFTVVDPTRWLFPILPTADPVNSATGELFQPYAPDINLGGPLPLTFTRYYAAFLKLNNVSSALGNNWMHNFDWKVTSTASTAVVTMWRGRQLSFKLAGSSWTPATPEMYAYQLSAVSGGGFRFFDPRDRLIYTFSAAGALIKIEDQVGNALTVTQGSNGPTDVSDGIGRSLHFSYDTSGKLAKVDDTTGRFVTFSFTGNDLTGFTDAAANLTTYSYTSQGPYSGLLSTATRPAANKPFTQQYNALGQVARQTDSRANTWNMTYDAATGTTSIADPAGNTTQHTNDGLRRLTAVKDANGQAVTLTYDANTRRASVTDRLGNKSSLAYDNASGYIASLTDMAANTTSSTYATQTRAGFQITDLAKRLFPDGAAVTFAYDASGNPTRITDQAGNAAAFTWNARGLPLTVTNALGGVTAFTYNADGTISTAVSEAGDKFLFAWDNRKRLTQIAYPDSSTASFQYDNLNNVTAITDERGKTSKFAFDSNNRLAAVTDAAGKTVTFRYDNDDRPARLTDRTGDATATDYNEAGLVKTVTNGAAEVIVWAYDKLRRPASIADGGGNKTSFSYDKEGNLASVIDALSRTSLRTVDGMGRPVKVSNALGDSATFAYDKMGRPVKLVDELGRATTIAYDPRGFVIGVQVPAGISTSAIRDALGNVTAFSDGNGNIWKRTFDKAGRLTSITDPLGRQTSYAYGIRGRLTRIVFPDGSVDITYDAAGNVTRKLYSDGTDQTYTYDDNNRLTATNNATFAYDAEGRMTNSNGIQIAWVPGNHLQSITVADGKTIAYTYDARGLVQTISDWLGGVTTFAYDTGRQLTSMTRPNGVTAKYAYDANGRLIRLDESNGDTVLATVAVTRDPTGRIVSEDRSLPAVSPAPGFTPFSYDAANQDTASTYDGEGHPLTDARQSYTWNLAGQLMSYSRSGASASRNPGVQPAGHEDPLGPTNLFYDGLNNLTGTSTHGIVLNYALPRPFVNAITPTRGGSPTFFVPTPSGAPLYSVNGDSLLTFFSFDPGGNLLLNTDASGATTQSYSYTLDASDVQVTGGGSPSFFTFLGAGGAIQLGGGSIYAIPTVGGTTLYDPLHGGILAPGPAGFGNAAPSFAGNSSLWLYGTYARQAGRWGDYNANYSLIFPQSDPYGASFSPSQTPAAPTVPNRRDMAYWIIRSQMDADSITNYLNSTGGVFNSFADVQQPVTPTACSNQSYNYFVDVPNLDAPSPGSCAQGASDFYQYIQKMRELRISQGCTSCLGSVPNVPSTRSQIAVFLIRAKMNNIFPTVVSGAFPNPSGPPGGDPTRNDITNFLVRGFFP